MKIVKYELISTEIILKSSRPCVSTLPKKASWRFPWKIAFEKTSVWMFGFPWWRREGKVGSFEEALAISVGEHKRKLCCVGPKCVPWKRLSKSDWLNQNLWLYIVNIDLVFVLYLVNVISWKFKSHSIPLLCYI